MIRQGAAGAASSPEVADHLTILAQCYISQGQLERAHLFTQRALSVQEQLWGPQDPAVAETLLRLAGLYTSRGDLAQARPLYDRALTILRKTADTFYSEPSAPVPGARRPAAAQADRGETQSRYQRTLKMLADSLSERSAAYISLGEYHEAMPLIREALDIYDKLYGAGHPNVTSFLAQHLGWLRKAGKTEEAASLEAWAEQRRSERRR